MFWGGIVAVAASMGVLAASHQVYVESKVKGVDRTTVVSILDDGAIVGIVLGALAWTVSPLFPDKRRRRGRLWGADFGRKMDEGVHQHNQRPNGKKNGKKGHH